MDSSLSIRVQIDDWLSGGSAPALLAGGPLQAMATTRVVTAMLITISDPAV